MVENFEKSIAEGMVGVVPGVVIGNVTLTESGITQYIKALGYADLEKTIPMKEDAVMFFASMTKLMSAVAAMQCVDRGLFSLDSPEDVARLLPEYAEPDIFVKVGEDGNAETVKAQKPPTLRQLLTHTSGMAYRMMHPWGIELNKRNGTPLFNPDSSLKPHYMLPLLFEPGTSWCYSYGTDWAGEMVARANNTTFEQYMVENICKPLGMDSTVFDLAARPELEARLVPTTVRGEDGTLAMDPKGNNNAPLSPVDHSGGLFSTIPDYLKLFTSILSNDGSILKKETVEEMSKPSLSAESAKAQNELFENPALHDLFTGCLPYGLKYDYALAGGLTQTGIEGRFADGTLSWGGMPNMLWVLDRKTGTATICGTQLRPPADFKCTQLWEKAQRHFHGLAKSKSST